MGFVDNCFSFGPTRHTLHPHGLQIVKHLLWGYPRIIHRISPIDVLNTHFRKSNGAVYNVRACNDPGCGYAVERRVICTFSKTCSKIPISTLFAADWWNFGGCRFFIIRCNSLTARLMAAGMCDTVTLTSSNSSLPTLDNLQPPAAATTPGIVTNTALLDIYDVQVSAHR